MQVLLHDLALLYGTLWNVQTIYLKVEGVEYVHMFGSKQKLMERPLWPAVHIFHE